MLYRIAHTELIVCWLVFAYVFLFRTERPKGRRAVATARGAMLGLFIETVAVFLAWFPAPHTVGTARALASAVLAPAGVLLAWWAVAHLGRQFRVHAGLWHNHQLVRTGPYGVVRHPIYLALFLMLLATALLKTSWPLIAAASALYALGTEIRIRQEDRLLASHFGPEFESYRRGVRAWLPPLR